MIEVEKGSPSEADIDTFLEDEAGQGYTREQAREYLMEGEWANDTKYGQYQLEGEKENYKEVLVMLPTKKTYTVERGTGEFDGKDRKSVV